MAKNIDMALLRAFVAVAQSRSMTRAAEGLNLSQGAVSQQISRLESLCGQPLFVRDRSGMQLTAFGERLVGRARTALAVNDQIWSEIDNEASAIRLGVPYDLAGRHLATVLKQFAEQFPQVDISLLCESSPVLRQRISDGGLELAIVEEPVGRSEGERLAEQPLVWAGAREGQAHLKAPLPISMVTETCAFRAPVSDVMQRDGRPWKAVFEGGSLEAAIAMASNDMAVTIWLASAVPAALHIIPPQAGLPTLPPFAINLYRSRSAQGQAITELVRQVQTAFA